MASKIPGGVDSGNIRRYPMLPLATSRMPLMESARPAVPAALRPAAALYDRLWRASPPLTAVGLLMLVVAIPSLVGVFADPRAITGAPAWLKPFKFAVSAAIY